MKEEILTFSTWEEIKQNFPDEWILLGNPEWNGATVSAGVVLYHGSDKRIVSMEGPVYKDGFQTITVIYTGKSAVTSHSGLLRPIIQR
jgi:hypothetical protein